MAYAGNLTCGDCGLTFTSRWGSSAGIDEYRCPTDHVVSVHAGSGVVVGIDGASPPAEVTLWELRGSCPACGDELSTGRLPACPVCGGRDHEVTIAGTVS